ncbi:hypothetical protein AB0I81_30745 [Nonomuraea sp. NPDC050404]|uniref:hypothetical protein n=1 Tax=Nonomuraea sp. NPDC050404 TaxID=3155783 RepID=UPI003403E27C
MNNRWQGTYASKILAERGISAWSTMADEFERTLPKLTAEVEACLSAAPWGSDAEGEAFRAAHFSGGGGPNDMLEQCGRLAKEIIDAGDRVRTAIDNTRQTDADIRHDLATGLVREV